MATPVTVKVALVENVRMHPNADRLELCDILGWQMAVPKGQYSDGMKVVFFPPDTVIPVEWADRFGVREYMKGENKDRIGKVWLRGEPSFGLAVGLPDRQDWDVGENVAEYFGATKYEPPIRAKCGDAERAHPLFPVYTDVENMRNYTDLFDEGEEVVATEKIHGTNCRVGLIEGVQMAGSMTIRRKMPVTVQEWRGSIYWYPFQIPAVKTLLDTLALENACQQVILFGEVYGGSIQDYSYGIEKGKGFGFAAFDLYINGRWVDHDSFVGACQRFGVETVPVLYRGPFSLEAIKAVSDGPSILANGLHIREGVVVRPVVERTHPKLGRMILKYVGSAYLLDKHSDYTDV